MERRVIHLLRAAGFLAVRTAGSHSPVDVVALSSKKLLLVQCKCYRGRAPSYAADIESLRGVPAPAGTERWLCVWHEGKGWAQWVKILADSEQVTSSILPPFLSDRYSTSDSSTSLLPVRLLKTSTLSSSSGKATRKKRSPSSTKSTKPRSLGSSRSSMPKPPARGCPCLGEGCWFCGR